MTRQAVYCRERLIQELRGSMYCLLGAFKGDFQQQAAHYEQCMRQLHTNLQGQLATALPQPDAPDPAGAWLICYLLVAYTLL